ITSAASVLWPIAFSTIALVLQAWKLLLPPKFTLVAVSAHKDASSRLTLFVAQYCAACAQLSQLKPFSLRSSFLNQAICAPSTSTSTLNGITVFSHSSAITALEGVWSVNSYFSHSTLLSAATGFTFTRSTS